MTLSITRSAMAVAILLFSTSFSKQHGEHPEQKNNGGQVTMIKPPQKVVVITGARFVYPLMEHWIEAYHKVNPNVQIIIESRGSTDPLKVDILAEVFDHDHELRKSRQYIYVARYTVLPVANSESSFARTYAEKGLTTDLIKQVFFDDMFTDRSKQKAIGFSYTVYTRLQRAGVPAVFSNYFGYDQKDLEGISIAGGDIHLLKALLRDSTAVTYLPLPLIYNPLTRKQVDGLIVLPVDLNGNRKVNDEEKFYDTIDRVIETLESQNARKINNMPIGYLHLSVDKSHASPEAIDFMRWINEHGQEHLHSFGYLVPEAEHFHKDAFNKFASQRDR